MALPKRDPSTGRFQVTPGSKTDATNKNLETIAEVVLEGKYATIDVGKAVGDVRDAVAGVDDGLDEVVGQLVGLKASFVDSLSSMTRAVETMSSELRVVGDALLKSVTDDATRRELEARASRERELESVVPTAGQPERVGKDGGALSKIVEGLIAAVTTPVMAAFAPIRALGAGIATFGKLVSKMVWQFGLIISAVEGFIVGFEKGDWVSGLREALVSLVNFPFEFIHGIFARILKYFGASNLAKKYEDQTTKEMERMGDMIRSVFDGVVTALENPELVIDAMVETVEKFFHDVGQTLRSMLASVNNSIVAAVAGLVRGFASIIPESVVGGEFVRGKLEDAAKGIEKGSVDYQKTEYEGTGAAKKLGEAYDKRRETGGRVKVHEGLMSLGKMDGGTDGAPERAPVGEKGTIGDVVKYLKSKGLKDHEAIGVTANLVRESNLDPTAFNPEGGGKGAFGIAQWRGARQDQLMDFAKNQGASPNDIKTQLDFLLNELKTTERRAGEELSKTKTPSEATSSFARHFERPGRKELESGARERVTEIISAEVSKGTTTASGAGPALPGAVIERAGVDTGHAPVGGTSVVNAPSTTTINQSHTSAVGASPRNTDPGLMAVQNLSLATI